MKLFRKPNSRFYWYDFTVRGHRYRRATQETKLARAAKAASVKLGSVIEGTDPFPSKPSVLSEFAERFDTWVEDGRLEEKTKKFYRNGWRLLKATPVAGLRVDQITGDFAEQLKFPGSAANANCALRTLRRMLHKAVLCRLGARTSSATRREKTPCRQKFALGCREVPFEARIQKKQSSAHEMHTAVGDANS